MKGCTCGWFLWAAAVVVTGRMGVAWAAMDQPAQPVEGDLFVNPGGSDEAVGDNAQRPLASIPAAMEKLRQRRTAEPDERDKTRTIWLAGGRYELAEPLTFTPEDGLVTVAALPGQEPVLDGGRLITDWTVTEVHGQKAWVAELPEVAEGKWAFRQLYVDGEPRPQPRAPEEGYFTMQDVPGLPKSATWTTQAKNDAFTARAGMFGPLKNLTDVEVVVVHWWIEERFPVVSYDPAMRLVKLGRVSRGPLIDDTQKTYARYYLNNVYEKLRQPGQWYLDRPAGKLIYLPLPGEELGKTRVTAPRLLQLVKIVGDPEKGQFVQGVTLRGLSLASTDWRHPGEDGMPLEGVDKRYGRGNVAAAPQAACDVPGVVFLLGAKDCAIEDCAIENVGWYGVEISDGCTGNRVAGCELRDLGAGGVKICGTSANEPAWGRTSGNRITDNRIHHGGRIFHSGIGVLAMHTFDNVIAHNEIHDLFYTGISVGWSWGYGPSVTCNNLVEKNHIYGIGQGLLSDMGGIYTLGVQPGTVIRGNLIHDVQKANYGGWGIYLDEGSSHIVVEDNIAYDTNGEAFHQHYGRENILRNNIFALGQEGVIAFSRAEEHNGLTLERNILVTRGALMFKAGYRNDLEHIRHISDLNLMWDVDGQPLKFGKEGAPVDLTVWQDQHGMDRHSLAADPKFADLEKRDFTLAADSPAFGLGFKAIDMSDVGPRPAGERK
ncbi:MAG: right-handed parallel beta-helix repeat-containing protein [Phycisphaeraceae bacterium]|nr:right-handed parallel beta-helix repeat-containing protein [Phycisphaeraceae bacterium]